MMILPVEGELPLASYYREKKINTYLKQQIVFIAGERDVRIAIRLSFI
ncbi:hypothetical protein ACLEE4_09880 [Lonsdalea quercina]